MQKPVIGRPKDLQKRHAILKAATQLFLELGYEGSSMDKIAKLAGVSKLTVYSHFQDKEHLFSAAIELSCEQRLPKNLFSIDVNSDIPKLLHSVGFTFLSTLYSPEAIKLTLLMSSLVQNNPELVHKFYFSGPGPTHQHIANLFNDIHSLNKLDIDDTTSAYRFFISLLTDVNYDHVLWKLKPVPSEQDIDTHVKQSLKIFFKVYPPIST